MKKLLITGVHGFVGSNLVPYLREDFEIYGLDIVSPSKEGVVRTFSWEDLDAGRIPDVDAVVHLAGKAHDTANRSAADAYFRINTGLTRKIVDWYLSSPTARELVFFSTVKAAADKVTGVLREDILPAPVGPYGESKLQAEEYIKERYGVSMGNAHEWPSIDGKEVYILRPCMIHGPGNKGNLNLLYKIVAKGIPWPLGAFENRRTFTSVGNICFVVRELLIGDARSGIYNMGDDDSLSTNELIRLICSVLGKKARVWNISPALMEALARVGGCLGLPLNPERMRKLTESYVASNEKIKKAIGVERLPVSAEEGLRTTIECFKDA